MVTLILGMWLRLDERHGDIEGRAVGILHDVLLLVAPPGRMAVLEPEDLRRHIGSDTLLDGLHAGTEVWRLRLPLEEYVFDALVVDLVIVIAQGSLEERLFNV